MDERKIVEIETDKGKRYFKVDKTTAKAFKIISHIQADKPRATVNELDDIAYTLASEITGSGGLPTEKSTRVRIISED